MLRPLFNYLLNKLTVSESVSTTNVQLKSHRDINQNNSMSSTNRCADETGMKPEPSELSFYGIIVYAESVDSDVNNLFEIKVDEEITYTVHLQNLKWNAIKDDKVILIGVRAGNVNEKIEFTNILPRKKKEFESGRVTAIENDCAVFEGNTILKFPSLKECPVLKMFDEYKYEAVEHKNAAKYEFRIFNLLEKLEMVEEKGIEFTHKDFKIFIENGKTVSIKRFVTVLNKSSRAVNLVTVEAVPLDSGHSLIRICKEGSLINFKLSPRTGKFNIFFEVLAEKCGTFTYDLVANFQEFEETYRFSVEIVKSYVLPATRAKRTPRFIDVRIDDYPVPAQIREVNFNKNQEAKERLLEMYPELGQTLSPNNYLTKMTLGIYLEEIALEKAFAAYHIERGVFEKKGEFLRLAVEGVAEKRPSIIVGDKIIATDPLRMGEERLKYEACISKIEHDSILCKFHNDFHKPYELNDAKQIVPEKEYLIDFYFSRTTAKRHHHALMKIFSRGALGTNFLFPSKKIACRDLQLDASLGEEGALMINGHPQKWFNAELNQYQKNAVINVLRGENRPLPYIVFGCPGGGKTKTVVETILQIFNHLKSSKILIATPSNSAANLITEMLLHSNAFDCNNPPFLRIVSHNQVEKELIPETLMKYCGTVSIAADDGLNSTAPTRDTLGIWQNCKKSQIKEYRIIIGTMNCIGSLMQMSLNSYFSHVIVDEAGQSIEPETLIPCTLLNVRKGQCVLAGDPKQLGPILVSRFGKIFNFNCSMLERLLLTHPYYERNFGPEGKDFDPSFVATLQVNYRSHPSVLTFYNNLFYNGLLQSAVDGENSPEASLLHNNTVDVLWKDTNRKCGIYFVDVENGKNKRIPESCSWYNPQEIKRIISFLSKCGTGGIAFKNIGIVTPYSLQVKKLREQINLDLSDTDLKIGTVEEFQGQERMVILVSTVRTSYSHLATDSKFGLGFIQCPKRMNVAISRARALLVVFGKASILENDAGWKKLIEYAKNNNTFVTETG